ncbi:hypothetical protein [Streptomyces lomondensis]|uniref:Lipoprotein n=1 Tax=Streptomyces lomondensis TaxID=68229 RepID=A0ABQ2X8J8_9ACTN|nr:hypothetical protein [Streptomyces lomondensis]MCF0077351.1 hypothetical protein [Streptomyces lomondensis]GGX04777.1 hypothetical protein GCM10010383_38370 [Streptomyces lomondensis]
MRKAVISLVLVSAVITGCGSAEHTPRGTPSPSAGEARQLTDAEQVRISDAQQQLIGTCMRRQGFEFWEAERLSLEESRTLGYVLDDVGWARKHGYGSRIQAKEAAARASNPNLAYRRSLSEQRRQAYDEALDEGVDAPVIAAEIPGGGTVRKRMGGCVAEAEKKLYGDPRAWFRAEKAVGHLRSLYVPRVLADQRFSAAQNAWSRCMKRAGYVYRDPGAARQSAVARAHRAAEPEVFEAERRLAVADATCARNTGLRPIGEERESHYVARLRDRYGEALDTHTRLQHQALDRAEKIVGPRA